MTDTRVQDVIAELGDGGRGGAPRFVFLRHRVAGGTGLQAAPPVDEVIADFVERRVSASCLFSGGQAPAFSSSLLFGSDIVRG
jgi:hypothetical protein